MSATGRKLMTADEFLVWRLDQEGTWELVDGVPMLKFDNGPEMMAGGTRNHARVAINVATALRLRLRGGPCYPAGADLGSRMGRGNVRQPDVTVGCGRGSEVRGLDGALDLSAIVVSLPMSEVYEDVELSPEHQLE